MSCEISVIYPGLEGEEKILEIPETRRAFGIVSFGSDPTVCFGSAPGMGGFVLDRWEAEEYGILPRHCALLWAGGKFRLEFDRHAGVYLNGSETCARSFCNPFEDGPEFEMRLGLPNANANGDDLGIAPVFRIRRTDRARRKSSWLSDLAMRMTWFRKVAMVPFLISLPAIVTFVAILTAGLVGWNALQSRQITEALIRGDIPQTVSDQFAQSVASIGVTCDDAFTPYGTAWLYEHHRASARGNTKWLVTNLHVIRQMKQHICEEQQQAERTIAKFPNRGGDATEAHIVSIDGPAYKHPLHDPFEVYRTRFSVSESGQEAVANVYDLAAFELDDAAFPAEVSRRDFLKLQGDKPETVSVFETNANFTQNLEPGRPVLILSYPTENQPFLAAGVSSEPFQFRATLQSKSNAMSRGIPGASSNRTPALYSFSAKSAGGMSGSPVIAIDRNQNAYVSAIVFSASFVRGPADASGGPVTRLASGDGTYALDAASLIALHDWPEESDVIDEQELEDIEQVWGGWSDGLTPMDEKLLLFSKFSQKNELEVCSTSQRLILNRRLRDEPGERGETPRPIPFASSPRSQRTLIVAEVRSSRDTDELIQLTLRTDKNALSAHREIGLNQASYLYSAKAPLDVDLTVAGPFKSNVVLTAYEAVEDIANCPRREGWE